MDSYLFYNGRLLDPRCDSLVESVELLVEGDRVKEVSRPDGDVRRPIQADGAIKSLSQ
jgi:hypothetical protein